MNCIFVNIFSVLNVKNHILNLLTKKLQGQLDLFKNSNIYLQFNINNINMKYRLLIAFISVSVILKAQINQVGFGIGKSVYWGDLNAPEFSTNLKNNGGLALQVHGKHLYSNYLGFKVNFLLGKIKADDKLSGLDWQVARNLNFKSNLYELSLTGEFYIFGYNPLLNDNVFSPYITAGISGFYMNPTTEYKGATYELQPLGTEGQGNGKYGNKYSKYNLGLPFGAGAVIRLSESMDISFDVIARRTFTDYIDDISGAYINYNELASINGEMAAILSDRTPEYLGINEPLNRSTGEKRGGQDVKDWYFTAMVTFGFNLTDYESLTTRKSRYKSNCPKF